MGTLQSVRVMGIDRDFTRRVGWSMGFANRRVAISIDVSQSSRDMIVVSLTEKLLRRGFTYRRQLGIVRSWDVPRILSIASANFNLRFSRLLNGFLLRLRIKFCWSQII